MTSIHNCQGDDRFSGGLGIIVGSRRNQNCLTEIHMPGDVISYGMDYNFNRCCCGCFCFGIWVVILKSMACYCVLVIKILFSCNF